jgi:hypothetical protein
MSLLAQGAQGHAPAVEGGAALVRLPGLTGVRRFLLFTRPLAGFEHDGFGRVWLLWLVWVVIHLSESPVGLSWVETKTASRMARLAAKNNFLHGCYTHAFMVYAVVIFSFFDLFDWGFRGADGRLNDSRKASQSPRP